MCGLSLASFHLQSTVCAVNLPIATGIVHWKPPAQAMDAVVASAGDHSLNQYGSGAGLPDLVKALKHKLATQNGLEQVQDLQLGTLAPKVLVLYASFVKHQPLKLPCG